MSEDADVKINFEHSAFEWVNVNEADARLMWPSDHQALAELRSVILANGPAKEYMRISL